MRVIEALKDLLKRRINKLLEGEKPDENNDGQESYYDDGEISDDDSSQDIPDAPPS